MVAEQAVKAGATLLVRRPRRSRPLVEGGLRHRRGRARDKDDGAHRGGAGALRRRGRRRQLPLRPGARHRPRPHVPARAWRSAATSRARCHDDPWIESHLDIRDRDGNHLPGYGWIFPVGDGTVNVGVGLLSTFAGWKNVNTSHLMDAFCATAPAYWGISPETVVRRRRPAASSRPGCRSRRTSARPGSSVGDAAGSVNPFNGEGISVAYETGRIAADVVDEALRTGDGLALAALRGAPRRGLRPVLQGGARASCARSATRR